MKTLMPCLLLGACTANSPAPPPVVEPPIQRDKTTELAEMRILSQMLSDRLHAETAQSSRVAPEEIEAFYENVKHEYPVEPHFSAYHLVVYVVGNPAFPDRGRGDAEARSHARAALAALRAKTPWKRVVSRYSDEVSPHRKDGWIPEGRFGRFAPEIEQAVRTQPLGTPGDVVRSAFGYHVIQVHTRVIETTYPAFSELRSILKERLSGQRRARAVREWMEPIRREVGLEVTENGLWEGPMRDRIAMPDDTILARIDAEPILEADFRRFVEDALIGRQRQIANARPGARQSMLRSYLDMRVLAEKARREGLDQSPVFLERRFRLAQQLRNLPETAHRTIDPACSAED